MLLGMPRESRERIVAAVDQLPGGRVLLSGPSGSESSTWRMSSRSVSRLQVAWGDPRGDHVARNGLDLRAGLGHAPSLLLVRLTGQPDQHSDGGRTGRFGPRSGCGFVCAFGVEQQPPCRGSEFLGTHVPSPAQVVTVLTR
ncbi:hypothetical protein AB0C96_40185 [Streptomyces sp. NPDC048506]|uniref:hypothetical protein n=1 Tax=Streptomyces sp. NPDC048506 TaxID=3155028 RepID=UPI00341AC066